MSDLAVAPQSRRPNPVKNVDCVTVACKLPNGLVLTIDEPRDVQEQQFGGGVKTVQQYFRKEERYTLNGSAMAIEQMMAGTAHTIVGGYALTPGIPSEFWDEWLRQHRHTELVRNGLVFAHKTEASARDQARDGAKIRTGMEAIDPDNPASASPEFRRIRKGTFSDRPDEGDAGA